MATKIARIQTSDGRVARIQVEVPDEELAKPEPAIKPLSLAERSTDILSKVPRLPVTPGEVYPAAKSLAVPLMSPTGERLERAGSGIKTSAQSVVEKIPFVGGVASGAVGLAPFTPTELTTEIGSSGMLALPALGRGTKVANSIANKFLGTPAKVLEKDIKRGAKTLGERLLDKGLTGSREKVFNDAIKQTDVLETKIQDILQNISKEEGSARFSTITKKEVARAFDELKKEYNPEFDQEDIRKLSKLKEQFLKLNKDKIITEWMNLKRSLYKQIGNVNYLKNAHSTKIEAKMAIAKKIRKLTEKVIPEIKQLNRDQGDYIEIANALGKTLAKGEGSITKALVGDLEQGALLQGARTIAPRGKGQYVAPVLRGQVGNVPGLLTDE